MASHLSVGDWFVCLALPGVACRSNGLGPLALAEDAWGSQGLGLVSVVKMFLIASRPPLFFPFNGHSRFCAINHIDANNRGILCFGRNRAAWGSSAVALALHRRSGVAPRLRRISPCAAAANARDAIAGKTRGKGGFKAFPENSARLRRDQRRGNGNRLHGMQERVDSLQGACIFETVYNAINSVYP